MSSGTHKKLTSTVDGDFYPGRRSRSETMCLVISVSLITVILTNAMHLSFYSKRSPLHSLQSLAMDELSTLTRSLKLSDGFDQGAKSKPLIFYDRPGKTGSTSIRIAMKRALQEKGMVAAKCFNRLDWNEMAIHTIIKRRDVDFYGCHTTITESRRREILDMRGGNVVFMTSTRNASDMILSVYMQKHRDRKVAEITDPAEMKREVDQYRKFVEGFPVNGWYDYHGAGAIVPLRSCPVKHEHQLAMQRASSKYEIVVALDKPEESAVIVEAVTGLRPNFSLKYNERTTHKTPMIEAMLKIDISHKLCGLELVHKTLMMQFNLIKDRLMQNRCFDEDFGSTELCDRATLTMDSIKERTREESFKERAHLRTLVP